MLKRYVDLAPKARSQFDASPDDPVDEFIAEADRHPVFELVEVPRERSASGQPP